MLDLIVSGAGTIVLCFFTGLSLEKDKVYLAVVLLFTLSFSFFPQCAGLVQEIFGTKNGSSFMMVLIASSGFLGHTAPGAYEEYRRSRRKR